MCLAPDPRECEIGVSSRGFNPFEQIVWDQSAPNIACTFNLDHIDTADQLREFSRKFPKNLRDTLMTSFCGSQVTINCAPGLETGCSRFLTTDDEGILCRDWLASLSKDRQDAVMRNYCLGNNTDDCKCINRTFDPDYENVKVLSNYFSDNCWYRPCANNSSIYLVPNALFEKQCATNVCQQIIDVQTQGQVDVSGNTNNINCNFKEGEMVPPKPIHSESNLMIFVRDNWIVLAASVLIIFFIVFFPSTNVFSK